MALINTTTTGNYGTAYAGDSSGDLTIQKDGTTINKITSAPCFSAYQSTVQSIASGVWTKIQLQSKYFDTAGAFDATTNYRFQPTVPGYYQLNCVVQLQFFASLAASIYKNGNGTDYAVGVGQASIIYTTVPQSKLVYLNGSTDYVELYAYQASGSAVSTLAIDCAFSGSLARSL